MTDKLYSIVVSINYISYLIIVLPLMLLYYLIANPMKRSRNKRVLKKELKKGGIPKLLRKEIAESYKDFTKLLSFSSILKMIKEVG
ncbi:MAG: hypothetical protein GPJ51_00480 [Candidatus Heimdallarchaeota archaeon]|nr:hypothetical protein [Candidatus Heimdallarchaeota archaeon]